MTSTALRKLVERQPFRSFTLSLSNGSNYHIETRSQIGATSDYRTVFYFGPDGDWHIIDREAISEVNGNGDEPSE